MRWGRRRQPVADAVTVTLTLDASRFMASMARAEDLVAAQVYRRRLAAERREALVWLDELVEMTWADYGWKRVAP